MVLGSSTRSTPSRAARDAFRAGLTTLDVSAEQVSDDAIGITINDVLELLRGLGRPGSEAETYDYACEACRPIAKMLLEHIPGADAVPAEAWGTTLYCMWCAATIDTRAETTFAELTDDISRWYAMALRCRSVTLGLAPPLVRRASLRPRPIAALLVLLGLDILLIAEYGFEGRSRVLVSLGSTVVMS